MQIRAAGLAQASYEILSLMTTASGRVMSAVGSQSQLLHAAIDAGIARGALDETIQLVKTYARPSIDRASDKASGYPDMTSTIGGSVSSSRRRRKTATS